MSPDGFKGKTWGPSTVHQRERCHLNTAIHSTEWHAANVTNNSSFSKSAPNLDKKAAAIRQQQQQQQNATCNTSPSSPINNGYNLHHSLHHLNSNSHTNLNATSPTTATTAQGSTPSSVISLSSPGTPSSCTASRSMVTTIHPAFVTLIQNNHNTITTTITPPTPSTITTTSSSNSSSSLAFHSCNSNINNNNNNINNNFVGSSNTLFTPPTYNHKANELRLSKKQLKKKNLLTKSHDGGLDSLLVTKKPAKPLPFECPLNTYDSDRDSITPTVVGCFPFKRNTSQLPLNLDKSPVHDLKQSNSLGNSPAIGRKKFSLDSRLSPLARRQPISYISPDISPLVGDNPFLTSCSQQGSLMLIDSNPDNPTYDRFFYTSLQKSLDEIFSNNKTPKTAGQASTKTNWQKSEPLSSKSSVNLTMYSSTSQLTEDLEDSEDPESPYYRFQRNGSGSQFPRHCFFRQPSNAQDKAQLQQNYLSKTPHDNNSSFRSYHSQEDPYNSMDNSSQDNSVNSQQTSRKSSMVTFHLNNNSSNNSSHNNSSILNSFEDCETEPNTSSSSQNHSISFATYYSEGDNSRHLPETPPLSIMAQRKLQDVQPDPEVIQMKQQLLQQQLLMQHQQQTAGGLILKSKDKTKKSKSKSSLTGETQSHSSNSSTLKTLKSFFSLGTLSRSKKKSQKSKSSYKLFQNTLDAQRDSIRISPQRTKSCDQLEMV